MGERGPANGGGGGGRGQGAGQGGRQRRRDGSGRGALLRARVDGRDTAPAVATPSSPDANVPGADVRVSAPAVVSLVRTVAIVATPESCIACGTCVETCPSNAITLDETAVIDASICTGCGLCVSDCAHGALALAQV